MGCCPIPMPAYCRRKTCGVCSRTTHPWDLMLESTACLAAHADSPGKRPDLRLDYIARAGRLHIPFTTGILVGIGESWHDREASLQAIADLHQIYGHIQEVIIQPLDPKPGTALANSPRPMLNDLCRVVKMAREILPVDVSIQIPPNLADPRPLGGGWGKRSWWHQPCNYRLDKSRKALAGPDRAAKPSDGL